MRMALPRIAQPFPSLTQLYITLEGASLPVLAAAVKHVVELDLTFIRTGTVGLDFIPNWPPQMEEDLLAAQRYRWPALQPLGALAHLRRLCLSFPRGHGPQRH
jgi:hypothetical protein